MKWLSYRNFQSAFNIEEISNILGTVPRDRATITDAELQTLSSQLHASDVNAVSGIVLNLQGKTTSGNTNDLAAQP